MPADQTPPREPARSWWSDFEDQLWPTNTLLMLLAGGVAGLVVGRADFQTDDWTQNGWTHLGILAGGVALLMLGADLLTPKQHRRMQLAILCSLLAHLILSLGLEQARLSLALKPAPVPSLLEPEPVTLPDYQQNNSGETPREEIFDKPVETEQPQLEMREVEREAATTTPVERATIQQPRNTPQVDPQPIELARAETSRPTPVEKLTGPQRSQSEPQPKPIEPIIPLPQTPTMRPEPEQPRFEAPQRRVQEAPRAETPNLNRPDDATPQQDAPRVERRTPSESRPENDAQVAMLRSSATMPQLPDASIASPSPVAAQASPRADMTQRLEDVARQSVSAPRASANEPAQAALPQVTPTVQPMARSRDERPDQQLARADTSRMTGPPELSLPTKVVAPERPTVTSTLSPAPGVQPSAVNLSKSGGGQPTPLTSRTAGQQAGGADRVAPSVSTPVVNRAPGSEAQVGGAGNSMAGPQTLARSPAGVQVATSAIPVSPGATADTTGARVPSALEVSASAGVGRQAASGPPGTALGAGLAPSGAGPVAPSMATGPTRATGGSDAALTPGSQVGSGTPLARSDTGGAIPGLSTAAEGAGTPTSGTARSSTGGSRGGAASEGLAMNLSGPTRNNAGTGIGTTTGLAPAGPTSATGRGFESASNAPSAPALAGGPRRSDEVGGGSGAASEGLATGSPLGRSTQSGGQADARVMTTVDVPNPGSGLPGSSPAPGKVASTSPLPIGPRELSSAGERSADRPPIPIAAPMGPGGLTPSPSLELGTPARRANTNPDVIASLTPRLILDRSGGAPAIDARVKDVAVEGLKQRDREMREAIAKQYGGNAATERAVELGLDFLARHQAVNGSWSLHGFAAGRGYADAAEGTVEADPAATGLALLAFLGAGYTHTDGKYRAVVERGLDYLVSRQAPNGDLFYRPDGSRDPNPLWYYSHGIASIALCEAYGMTRDRNLMGPAQQALKFIVESQNPAEGAWRYGPQLGSDTSVSGWQLMALKSGELAGLEVPKEAYQLVTRWLDHAQGAGGDPSRYAYRPTSEQADQREPSHVMTAEALLMRQYLGWRRDNPHMVTGANWLVTLRPELGDPSRLRPYGRRDAYYWYYGTQVMFQMQGDHWRSWNEPLRDLLVQSQQVDGPLAGSWHPARPIPDRWGTAGGRIYVTCLHLLMLEVYYRHLPIYRTLEPGK